MIRISIALVLAGSALTWTGPVLAQSSGSPAGIDGGADWTLDTSGVKATHKKKGAAPQGAPTAEEAARAAHLAEGRRKFFGAPAEKKNQSVPEFGGYNAATDSGAFRPGAQFRF